MSRTLDEEACWQSVLERDRTQDGRFFFGVITTGIFCRPSCAARRPLRRNTRFFRTAEEAEREGLRPCRRCHPLEEPEKRSARIEALCEHIRRNCDSGQALTLEVLAGEVGISVSKLRREFREVTGMTPHQYVDACRFEALKRGLREGDNVTDAIYGAGFGSSSRVYEQATGRLGMTPSQYGAGGSGLTISYACTETPLGPMLVAATDRGLCSVLFADREPDLLDLLREEFPAAQIEPMTPGADEAFRGWMAALHRHLRGELPSLGLPLDVRASAFQWKVWRYLQTIPSGETRSYSEVAAGIGQPKAARAVARACAANRAALVIPCHRVIRSDGAAGGYRWGEARKRLLLDRERAAAG